MKFLFVVCGVLFVGRIGNNKQQTTNNKHKRRTKMTLTPAQHHQQLVKTTKLWVAQTFYGEMLKEMRDSPFKSSLFDGGHGGEAFQAQLDEKLAERMSDSKAGKRLVDSIVRKIEANKRKPDVAATH
jgi:Rod binding domain-containing protein